MRGLNLKMKDKKTSTKAKEKEPINVKAFIEIGNYVEKIQNIDKRQIRTQSAYAEKMHINKKEEFELLQQINHLQEEKAAILQEKNYLLKKEREEEESRNKQKVSNVSQLSSLKEKFAKEEEEILSQLEKYSKELETIEQFIIKEPSMKEELDKYENQLKVLHEEEALIEQNRVAEIDEMKFDLKQEALVRLQAKNTELFLKNRTGFDEEVRLIIAQNHHYYSELEFQTQHKANLEQKNVFLNEQLERLKKEADTHCQIEQELSKRKYFCSKIIKELTSQNVKLKEEIIKKGKEALRQPASAPLAPVLDDPISIDAYKELLKEYRHQCERKQSLGTKLNLYSKFICSILNHIKGLQKCFACPQVFEEPAPFIFINETSFESLSEEQQYYYFKTIEKAFTDLYYLC